MKCVPALARKGMCKIMNYTQITLSLGISIGQFGKKLDC